MAERRSEARAARRAFPVNSKPASGRSSLSRLPARLMEASERRAEDEVDCQVREKTLNPIDPGGEAVQPNALQPGRPPRWRVLARLALSLPSG